MTDSLAAREHRDMRTSAIRTALTCLAVIVTGVGMLVLPAPGSVMASPPGPPVPGPVLHGFDPPEHDWLPGNRGVDLAASPGQAVRSVTAGTVVFAGRVAGVGVVSVELADGRRTTHLPVVAAVHLGERVVAGQVIGHVDSPSWCSTSCLHWGLKRGNTYFDPMSLLGPRRVRLLPAGARPRADDAVAAGRTEPDEAVIGSGVRGSGHPVGRGAGNVPAGTRGVLDRPVAGRVSSPFGMRLHPVSHVWRLHTGVDLAAGCGTPVVASTRGRVTASGPAGGYGNRVVVDHGVVAGHRLMTTYNHLSARSVGVGRTVARGTVVGRVGSTGTSTGCHLHWEVMRDGSYVDPLRFR